MRKKAYRSISVKDVNVTQVLSWLGKEDAWVGVDVAKRELLVVVWKSENDWQRPWKVQQPAEIPQLVEILKRLAAGRRLVVALESTGTYGDPLRQALSDAGVEVRRVRSTATKAHSEAFDGVPSQHDGKDAAVLAELAAMGKSQPWPSQPPSREEGILHGEVAWMDTQRDILQLWLGRIEALLARHWPEATTVLSLTSGTLRRVLKEYGGPRALAQDPQAAEKIALWSGKLLEPEKIERLLAAARTTVGVRMTEAEEELMQRIALEAREAERKIERSRRVLERATENNEVLRRMSRAVGRATACVLFATLGDPREYSCGAAYRKGLGLNLKERTSGTQKGQLKITKRGPSLARRWLFFSALRAIQMSPVKRWYERKKLRDQGKGGKGVVAVMRKLALALYAVTTRNQELDAGRLFPGRPPVPRAPDPVTVRAAACESEECLEHA
jgi:transposase